MRNRSLHTLGHSREKTCPLKFTVLAMWSKTKGTSGELSSDRDVAHLSGCVRITAFTEKLNNFWSQDSAEYGLLAHCMPAKCWSNRENEMLAFGLIYTQSIWDSSYTSLTGQQGVLVHSEDNYGELSTDTALELNPTIFKLWMELITLRQ